MRRTGEGFDVRSKFVFRLGVDEWAKWMLLLDPSGKRK
jgi:hypothetical protein